MQDTEYERALSKKLNRLSKIAARDSKIKLTSLAYLLTKDFRKVCYRELNHQQARTVGHISYTTYCENLDQHIAELIKRPREERYRICYIRRDMDTKAGWEETAFRDSRSGRKNRPERGGDDEVICRLFVNLTEAPDAFVPQIRFSEVPGITDTWLE